MLERLGIIVTIAFLVTRIPFFRKLIEEKEQLGVSKRLIFAFIFGVFGIIGTYTGVAVNTLDGDYNRWLVNLASEEAIANSRVIGVVVAGLLGGWKLGFGAGVVAGVHRFTLGGFTGIACGISTVVAGVMAGLIHRYYRQQIVVPPKVAFLVGMLAEAVQMMIILLVAKPFGQSYALVSQIGVPMIVANGIGAAIFMLVIQNVIRGEEKVKASESQKALSVADSTVKFMRQGLNATSAKETCIVLQEKIGVDAVAMTNKEEILAHVGLASEHHVSGGPIQTEATKRAMELRKTVVVYEEDIHCHDRNCPLHTAIIAPLIQQDEVVGTLKFYFATKTEPTLVMRELVEGLGSILSTQLELAQIDQLENLAQQAELKALQAQVSPHFLFNALNVIHSLIRVEPLEARKVLLALSTYLRGNLNATHVSLTTIEDELRHVEAYLRIEEARFHDRLQVTIELDESCKYTKVPTLSIQPLVENAIKHGMRDKSIDGKVSIAVGGTKDGWVRISIRDNGSGIESSRLQVLGNERVSSEIGTGIGVWNVKQRVKGLLGGSLEINSVPQEGTTVTMIVPREERSEV
ncbi:sensor histidine kinase [Mangrovibacillus cuniculi]|nr:sensor histidine kinase [Mangrovibacillus cuniculi]